MFIFTTPYDIASRISSRVEPEPPWNTRSRALCPKLYFLETYSCESLNILGVSFTLPGLYTPCTLPKAAAIVNCELTFESSS